MTKNHRFVWPNYLPNNGVRVVTNSLTKSDCNRFITSHRDSKVESARNVLAVASGRTKTCNAFHKTPHDIECRAGHPAFLCRLLATRRP